MHTPTAGDARKGPRGRISSDQETTSVTFCSKSIFHVGETPKAVFPLPLCIALREGEEMMAFRV